MAFLIFAGQSNAGGFGLTAADLPAPLAGWTDSHVQIWTPTGWQVMQAGVNTGTPTNPGMWGPEVKEAYDFRQAHPTEDVWIVKDTKGSTPLAQASGLDWSPSSSGELFDETAAQVAAARASLGGVHVDAIFWTHGETDATDSAQAAAYQVNEQVFLSAARAAWAEPSTTIIFARIADDAGQTYAATVRAAQAFVDGNDANAHMVNTDAFGMQPDNLHFSGAGQASLGDAYYAAFEAPRFVFGDPSNEVITGANGADYLWGADGNDLIFGGAGGDSIHGNAGSDTEQGNSGEDLIQGGKGNDALYGGMDHDIVYGDLDNDTVYGGGGLDWARGGKGDDSLDGGDGDDLIFGDLGNDTMAGGLGADTFFVSTGVGSDRITDWNAGDRILIEDHAAYSFTYAGGDTTVTLSGASIVVVGATLTASDIIA